MKILYIITKSEAGGAQTHVAQLAQYMSEQGHQVAVMAHSKGWLAEEMVRLNVPFYINPFLVNNYNPFTGLRAILKINNLIKKINPDIVSCHSSVAGLWGRLAVHNQVPTVFTAHGWGFTDGVGWLRKFIVTMCEYVANPFCKKVICVSDKDRLLGLGLGISPSKCITIHNGVENLEKVSHEGIRIVFVGRLSHPKKPEVLLEVFCKLSKEIQNSARIDIVGGGDKQEMIERFVSEKELSQQVVIHGALSRKQALEVLSQGDLFVLISDYEGFPRSILEAMSFGIPVIASDVGGVREAVTPEVGVVISRGDKQGLYQALVGLLIDSEKRNILSINAAKRARELFSLEAMLTKTETVYKELLG